MWTEFMIGLPEREWDRFSGDSFRAWAASHVPDVPQALYHYETPDRAAAGFAPVRFVAGQRWVGLRGFGRDAERLIAEQGHRLTQALCQHLNAPALPENWRSGSCEAAWVKGRDRQYAIHRLAPGRHPSKAVLDAARCGQLDNPDLLAAAERAVRHGFERQAKYLNYLMPDFEIRNLAVSRTLVVPVATRVQLVLGGVTFAMPLDLRGPWQVGSLQARGMGNVRRVAA